MLSSAACINDTYVQHELKEILNIYFPLHFDIAIKHFNYFAHTEEVSSLNAQSDQYPATL